MAAAREIPGLGADLPFGRAAARVLEVRVEELFEHQAGVLDIDDIERVHDMRVATRRLRAVLEIFAPCFPPRAHRKALREVKALADALGERRDPDVQIGALRAYMERAPASDSAGVNLLVAQLGAEQRDANIRLAAALERIERENLRGRLLELAEALP